MLSSIHPSSLRWQHRFIVGEPHALCVKSVGLGGPTLNSIFNSRGGPWLAYIMVIHLRMGRESNQSQWESRIIFPRLQRKYPFSSAGSTRRKCLYPWMVWDDNRRWGIVTTSRWKTPLDGGWGLSWCCRSRAESQRKPASLGMPSWLLGQALPTIHPLDIFS